MKQTHIKVVAAAQSFVRFIEEGDFRAAREQLEEVRKHATKMEHLEQADVMEQLLQRYEEAVAC